jgi:hypothetical protein
MKSCELPFGWQRPVQVVQGTLFPRSRDEVLRKALVRLEDLKHWHDLGWLSFDGADSTELDRPETCELLFVRNIARCGLSDAAITDLLSGLNKPYRYDPELVAYSFLCGWVQRPAAPVVDEVDRFFQENLKKWIDGRLWNKDLLPLVETTDEIVRSVAEYLDSHPEEDYRPRY